MAISGGIKFFSRSKNLFEDGASMVATSGDDSSNRALDRNRFSYWRSVGSMDTITETLTITFPESTEIDRLLLIDHNWKEFTAQYDNGGVYTDFTNIIGIDGSVGTIAETAFADNTAYYEFDAVTTTSIQLTVTKTQTADQEKYINQIIATKELATLQGYPILKSIAHSRNLRKRQVLSGRTLIQKSEESMDLTLDFKNYPPSYSADIDLIFTLHDEEDDFIIWPCGGRRGSDYFAYQLRGWRLEDAYSVQVDNDLKISYSKNVYQNTINASLSLVETP